uniref:Alcohol O-acetyltransferase 2 n=1 Tax=Lygus hesperus TaxID=30085 RepID=A0A0A9XGZ2_LYGHE
MSMLKHTAADSLARMSAGYTTFGLMSGIYFRQLTRYMGTDPHVGQLRILHTHCLALGTIFNLIALVLEKQCNLSAQKSYKKFTLYYHFGLGITLTMMTIHGTFTTVGHDLYTRWFTYPAAFGHGLISLGFYYFFDCLQDAMQAENKTANVDSANKIAMNGKSTKAVAM